MYENINEHLIRKQMLDSVGASVSKREGTLIYDSLSPVANELAKHYIELDSIINMSFLQTSYGNYLDLRCAEFGVFRKTPTKATGVVKITGTANLIINKGFLVATIDKKQYMTTESITLTAGVGYAKIEAENAGSLYNANINEVNTMIAFVTGITAITNESAIIGGTDIETDEELRARALLKARTYSTSGNMQHYKNWALEVAGTGDVKVFPNYYGPGTVHLVMIDSLKKPLSNDLLSKVRLNVEANRPIGATVSVAAALPMSINITVTVMKDSNYASIDVINNIKANLSAELRESAFIQDYVSNAKLANAILTADGVLDYSDLYINGMVGENITLRDINVAVLGFVNINIV